MNPVSARRIRHDLPQLAQAHRAVELLASDPIAAQSASRELQSAREALDRAEKARSDKEPTAEIVHLAYVAQRQAEIGAARLGEVRARQLLEAREREARLASSEAAANAQAAEAAKPSRAAGRTARTVQPSDLSRRRAAPVATALEARGISTSRVNVAGRGEALPVANNETPAGRQRNRRVEIVFSDLSGNFANDVAQR